MTSSGNSGPNQAKHNHGLYEKYNGKTCFIHEYDIDGNLLVQTGWTDSGAHTHEEHSHNVTIPSHNHTFSWNHYHNVEVGDHDHQITLEDHVHDITYGIYEGATADAMKLVVDGNEVGVYESFQDVNIIPYLDESNGIISRGTHTVEVYPVTEGVENAISRIELDMSIQLFANSRGGGQY